MSRRSNRFHPYPERDRFQRHPEKDHFQLFSEKDRFQQRPVRDRFQRRPDRDHFQSYPEKDRSQQCFERDHLQQSPERGRFQRRLERDRFQPYPEKKHSQRYLEKDRSQQCFQRNHLQQSPERGHFKRCPERDHFQSYPEKEHSEKDHCFERDRLQQGPKRGRFQRLHERNHFRPYPEKDRSQQCHEKDRFPLYPEKDCFQPNPERVPTSRNGAHFSKNCVKVGKSDALKSDTTKGFKPRFTATVKVENLSKNTTEASLNRMCDGDSVAIHLMSCGPAHPANYAYVNCHSSITAERIIRKLDNKLMDGNLLQAKLKGNHGESSDPIRNVCSTSEKKSGLQPPKNHSHVANMSTVKVLISGGHLFVTGDPLDEYFSKYGDVTTRSIIRHGSPDYAYINFQNPLSAERCRAESPHVIQGVEVTALPFKPGTGAGNTLPIPPHLHAPPPLPFKPGTGAGNTLPIPPHLHAPPHQPSQGVRPGSNVASLANSEFSCHPLVSSYVEKDANRYFQANGLQVIVLVQQYKISLFSYTSGGISAGVEDFMKRSIDEHEGKRTCLIESLDCCYLPALVDQSVEKKLSGIQAPFKLQIKAVTAAQDDSLECRYDSLEDLKHAYSKCSEKSVHSSELKQYVCPSGPSHYQWSWEDESSVFKSYDSTTSEELERVLASSNKTTTVTIGRHKYKIDTSKMLQKNVETGKERKIKREVLNKNERYNITLRINAHSDHMEDIKKEIVHVLFSVLTETSLAIPIDAEASFTDHLLQKARERFVSADRDAEKSNSIVLRGVLDEEKKLKIKLQEEILEKLNNLARLKSTYEHLSTPDHWEKQESEVCDLKPVAKGSEEWNGVEKRLKESEFHVSIVRIERIQNPWLWEVYANSRKRMSDKNNGTVNEKQLFHGTRSTPPKKIYNSEQGFDSRLSSKGMWGEGAYFAVKASYSDGYAHHTAEGHKQMFLAMVLTGITCKCSSNSSIKAPPKKSEFGSQVSYKFEDERYDSVNGFTSGSEIFVIYEHGKVYPAYLITYKTTLSSLFH